MCATSGEEARVRTSQGNDEILGGSKLSTSIDSFSNENPSSKVPNI